MRKTKIVCTIGPASENKEVLTSLIKAGLNVMRLNFSHGDHAEHLAKVNTLREINKELGTNVAFMLDTMGPEIRTTDFEDGEKHKFTKGDKLTLTTRAIKGNDKVLGITYEGLPNDVEVGGHILIDDGLIDLIVDKIDGTEIECTLQNSGMLKGRRGINVPGAKLQLKAMTDKDKDDLRFAVENNFDFVAASFIRKPQDVLEMREYLDSVGENRIKIISKIENQEGLDNFDEILKVTDGVMVARGDLGVEIPMEELPAVQKMMIKKCVLAGKPVITATQMLDSMQSNPRPTRAEVSDVANAIYDGTSAIMLSGESAQGDYPLECVQTMAKIADATEANIDYWKRFKKRYIERLSNIDKSELSDDLRFKQQSNFAVCCSAMFSNADAIIAVSEHSITPSMLSGFKPDCPVYVITANQNTYRQMGVEHNVYAVYIPNENNFDNILSKGIDILKEKGLLKKDDTVVLSGGFPQETKRTFLSNHATGTILKI